MNNILILTGSMGAGGAERQINELIKRSTSNDIKFHLFILSKIIDPFGEELITCGTPVFYCKNISSLYRLLLLRKYIIKYNIKVIYSFLCVPSIYGYFASRFTSVKYLIPTIRFTNPNIKWQIYLMTKIILKKSILVIVNAERVKYYAIKKFGISENKIKVIYNGIDTEKFKPNQNKNKIIIGTVGKWSIPKNPKLFLKIIDKISMKYCNIEFCMVGYKKLGYENIKNDISLQAYNKINFIEYTDKMCDIYSRFTIFLLTSISEGMPNALCEAMACGIPSICNNVGGCAEIIQDGESGYLIESYDVAGFIEKIEQIVFDTGKRRIISENARKRIIEKYSVERMVSETLKLFTEICAK